MKEQLNDLENLSANLGPFFEELITLKELLVLLRNQYSRPTIYRWVQKENMPHYRIKGKLWFPKSQVLDWLTQDLVF